MANAALPVVVVGAGLTGLTTAVALSGAGRAVLVLELADRPGGVLRSRRSDGFLAEESANSMMIKTREVEDFIGRLGLNDRLVDSNPVARKRYMMRDGRVLAMPMSAGQALSTPLYSGRAKLRLLAEPFVRRAPAGGDESVAAFVRRRLGPELLDYGIAPLAAGIFAGDPERLSMRHAFPTVWNLEASYGSLTGGAVKRMREMKRRGEARYKSRVVSFRDGLETLTDTLARRLGGDLTLGAQLRSLRPAADGWQVDWADALGDHALQAAAIVCTVPLPVLGQLPWTDDLRETCAAVPVPPHPPVTVLSLGYRREQVAHSLDGFGMLAPPVENRRILGAIFCSTLFPGRAPDGHVLFMVFMGGATRPELASPEAPEAVRVAGEELGELFGVGGTPVFVHHRYWPAAIPQYNLGHGQLLGALESVEAHWPGLYLAGNYRGGPGINDCVVNGLALARRLA